MCVNCLTAKNLISFYGWFEDLGVVSATFWSGTPHLGGMLHLKNMYYSYIFVSRYRHRYIKLIVYVSRMITFAQSVIYY